MPRASRQTQWEQVVWGEQVTGSCQGEASGFASERMISPLLPLSFSHVDSGEGRAQSQACPCSVRGSRTQAHKETVYTVGSRRVSFRLHLRDVFGRL